ncbi:MAG: hypothetical protein K0Q87_5224 [Neobacillus sp.]|nr:hypothetical protein [Neobacillus sp.]
MFAVLKISNVWELNYRRVINFLTLLYKEKKALDWKSKEV